MPRLWHFTILLSTITAIDFQPSVYYIACDDNSSNFRDSALINDSTTTSFLSRIAIPISDPNVTCILGIFLSNNGSFTFEEDSKCKISFELQQTNYLPTISPSSHPSIAPTLNPATSNPTLNPATSNPTLNSATSNPTHNPATSNPTEAPSKHPSVSPTVTTFPTIEPTADPTEMPTIQPTQAPFIDIDDIELTHIFNVNHDNIFWRNTYNSSEYRFQIAPHCGSNAFADEAVFEANGNITSLISIITQLPDQYNLSTQDVSVNTTLVNETALFPNKFSISSHDSSEQTLFSSSVRTDLSSSTNFSCAYDNAFQTVSSTDDVANDSFLGIDYYLFVHNLRSNMQNLTLDIWISKTCVMDSVSSMPSSDPTMEPSIVFEFSSTVVAEDSGEEEIFGVDVETFIAICVVVFVIIGASVIVVVCLYKRKSIWEDVEQDNTIQLKEPKQHKATELVSNKFIVTEEDHEEMLRLARENSLSTGLQT